MNLMWLSAGLISQIGWVAQGFVQLDFENVQEWSCFSLSGQLVPVPNNCLYVVDTSSGSTNRCHLFMSGKRERKSW